jgi:hypothetical protein
VETLLALALSVNMGMSLSLAWYLRKRHMELVTAKIQNDLDTQHLEVLADTLKSTGEALDRQKAVSKEIMSLFLAQKVETNDAKEECERLERELAMAEECIHVLTPARDDRGRFSCPRVSMPMFENNGARLSGTV